MPRGSLSLGHVSKWAPPRYESLTGGPHLSATWQTASGPPHHPGATWHHTSGPLHSLCATRHNQRRPPHPSHATWQPCNNTPHSPCATWQHSNDTPQQTTPHLLTHGYMLLVQLGSIGPTGDKWHYITEPPQHGLNAMADD